VPESSQTLSTLAKKNMSSSYTERMVGRLRQGIPHHTQAVMAALIFLRLLPMHGQTLPPMTVAYQLTHSINIDPSMSPDGKRVAFRRIVGENNSEVFVASSDGSDAKNLTNSPSFDGWPAWSPDGYSIAFASNRNSSYEIYVMNPDGSEVRKVAGTEGRATAPQWSRDSKTIYFPNCRKVDFKSDCQIFGAKLDAFKR
jgi:tricorn protease-like protein